MLTREVILSALRQALEPLDYVNAMWEGGAASFSRVDEWSDIDLQMDVADDHVDDVVRIAEAAMNQLSGIELKFEIPQPSWHGHYQAFYRLNNASPFLLIDFVVIKNSNPNKFLQPEIHNQPVVHFDKNGTVKWQPLERASFIERLRARAEFLRISFDIFQILTVKEINRGNSIEAMAFYHTYTLRPLVEALRLRYTPTRHNFHARYIQYEFPAEDTRRIEALFYPRDLDDLRAKRDEAERWFNEAIAAVDFDALDIPSAVQH